MKFKLLKRSLTERYLFSKLGIFFFRYKDLVLPAGKILLKGKYKRIACPKTNENLNWEFKSIFIDDCYNLRKIKETPKVIVDVGANIGYFSIIARKKFPKARILAYEPNLALETILTENAANFSFEYIPYAVGNKNSRAELLFTDNILTTQTQISESGSIIVKSTESIINDVGTIDILKLDCEGAEWDIFKSKDLFKSVRYITMEYHLWANPQMTVDKLKEFLISQNYEILSLVALDEKWGMLFAKNKAKK